MCIPWSDWLFDKLACLSVREYVIRGQYQGDRIRSRAPMTYCNVVLLLFSVGGGWVALSMHPEEYPPRKDYKRIACKSLYSTTCLY